MEKLTVLKVGGKILENEQSLHDFLNRFAKLEGKKVLVHGGGRTATELAKRMGVETVMVEGRRVTDENMLEIVTMVYGGLVNKRVVAQLQARGVNALGLTGADMNIISSHKRPVKTVDYGFVGDVDCANGIALKTLVDNGVTPVVAPLTHDGKGQMLNTNADTMAGETAKALAPYYDVTLMFCFEHAGVLSNGDDETSLISSINEASFEKLTQSGVVSGGMIPKIHNSLEAVRAGVTKVIITRADAIDGNHGTVIS